MFTTASGRLDTLLYKTIINTHRSNVSSVGKGSKEFINSFLDVSGVGARLVIGVAYVMAAWL